MLIIDYVKHKAFSGPMPTTLIFWVGFCLGLWLFAHFIYSFIAWDWGFYLPQDVEAFVRGAYAACCFSSGLCLCSYAVEKEV